MRNEARTGRCVARVLSLFAVSLPAVFLPAQDGIALHGNQTHFDSGAFARPALGLGANGSALAVLRDDQRVYLLGQCNLPSPPPPAPGLQYTQVRLGDDWYQYGQRGFALQSDGTVLCWSDGGPLQPAPALPPGTTYVDLAAGSWHALALRSDGFAVVWGDNSYGQCNLLPLAPGVTVLRVLAAGLNSMVLLSNGQLLAFGDNRYGQCNVPALPPNLTWTDAWLGSLHAVARRSDGAVLAWGRDDYGQCQVPALPAGVTYLRFGVGSYFTIAERSDGVLAAWGSFGTQPLPQLPPSGLAELVCGSQFAALRGNGGEVITWNGPPSMPSLPNLTLPNGERWITLGGGGRLWGLTSLGRVLTLDGSAAEPAVPAGMYWTALTGGGTHAAALRSDGRAYGFGSGSPCAIPVLPPGMRYTAIDASYGRTALVRSDGTAVATDGASGVTLATTPPGVAFTALSVSDRSALLLQDDGALLVVGAQTPSQLQVPALPADVRWTQVGMLDNTCAALRSDGQIAVWGAALYAPLPALPNGVSYVQIDSFGQTLAARRSDGQVVTASHYPFEVPPPWPGESYVEARSGSSVLLRVGPTRTFTTFANGCAGSLPACRLVPQETPRLGQTLEVELLDLPIGMAVVAFAWQRQAPVSLSGLGLPGCAAHVPVRALLPVSGSGHAATQRLPIPNQPALLGLSFVEQAIVFDPTANALGAVVSDAVEGVIGLP